MEADIVPQFMCWENIAHKAQTIMRSTSGESFFCYCEELSSLCHCEACPEPKLRAKGVANNEGTRRSNLII